MKAVVFSAYGSPDLLSYQEVKTPTPKGNEVLIKIHASSVNSWDWDLMWGRPYVNRMMFGLSKPKKINILGADIAGHIVALGKDVKEFNVGDEVFGDLTGGSWSTFAEFAVAKEEELALKPTSISFENAAAIPQAAVLALQSVQDKDKVDVGQKILINGAGGGVGTFAIQILKSWGAEITAVDSAKKLDMLQSIGANQVIDYKTEDFTKSGKQYDLIIDVVGNRSIFDYKKCLVKNGRYVMIGGSSSLIFQTFLLGPFISLFGSFPGGSGKKMEVLMHEPNKNLKQLLALIEEGTIQPIIAKKFPLSETADAIRFLGEGHAEGKVIITM
jgi:NADPH:quinone reductase-like Zn-dependent oxidoreductase